MKDKHIITKSQAKRFLLLKHGLLGEYKFAGKKGILDYVKQAGCIQYDPIDVCGKNHELVLFSKVKDFKKEDIFSLLYEDRKLIDCLDKCMSICMVGDWPYFEKQRADFESSVRSKEETDIAVTEILDYIRENGPACSSDIEFDKKVDWYWSSTSMARAAMDRLFYRGDLLFHHKKNTRKYYDLAERLIGPEIFNMKDPNKTMEEKLEWNVLRRMGSVGMLHNNASYAFIGVDNLKTENRNLTFNNLKVKGSIEEVYVEGIGKSFYYRSDDKPVMEEAKSEKSYKKRVEFLAPLDNMMWDRKIISELFDFDYKWEIYTPEKDRVYGYYVVPVLYGEDLIGRIEMRRDKGAGKIVIKNLWIDSKDKAIKELIENKAALLSDKLFS